MQMDNKPARKQFNYNYLSVVLIYIWAIAFLVSIPSIADKQSRMFPIIVSTFAILLATIFFLKTYFAKGKGEFPDFTGSGMAIIMTVLLIIYVGAIWFMGFYLATPFYLYATMWVLGQRRKRLMISISLLMPLGVYLFFRLLLGMRIPEGILLSKLLR
jgi:uncharacterized membrane protein